METIDKDWSLFLDRDGVINELLEGQYISSWAQWRYTENALKALVKLSNYFQHTFVVTNQLYHAPQLATQYHSFRKPRTGMAKQAQKDFPTVDFRKSIMVGDFVTDMQFAKKLGMLKVFIHKQEKSPQEIKVDYSCKSLWAFAQLIA